MSFSTLTYDVSDRIGVMTFTQPERLNALSEARLGEIEAVQRMCAEMALH